MLLLLQVLKVQEMLRACEAKGAAVDHKEVFKALSEARELEMDLDIMTTLSKKLKVRCARARGGGRVSFQRLFVAGPTDTL
jgi:flagellar biosynthesis regulator FlbT